MLIWRADIAITTTLTIQKDRQAVKDSGQKDRQSRMDGQTYRGRQTNGYKVLCLSVINTLRTVCVYGTSSQPVVIVMMCRSIINYTPQYCITSKCYRERRPHSSETERMMDFGLVCPMCLSRCVCVCLRTWVCMRMCAYCLSVRISVVFMWLVCKSSICQCAFWLEVVWESIHRLKVTKEDTFLTK